MWKVGGIISTLWLNGLQEGDGAILRRRRSQLAIRFAGQRYFMHSNLSRTSSRAFRHGRCHLCI